MRFTKRFVAVMLASVTATLVLAATASGQSSRTYVQDFETDTSGWFNSGPGTIARVPSGYSSAAGYGDSILSAHGNWHARLRTNNCDTLRFTSTCTAPFTRWGKPTSANAVFPDGGFMTELDIYLDVPWVATNLGRNDYRFDWISAINNSAGSHKRDFVFNVGTPLTTAEALATPGYYINASTNSTRSSSFPQNLCPNPSTAPNYCRTPVKITQSGWYTFRHEFYPRHHMGTDYLAVDFTVLRHDGVVMANWFISVTANQEPLTSDTMATIGGDRYGWFSNNEINDLAIDCTNLRPRAIGHPPLRAACAFRDEEEEEDDGDGDGDDDGDDDSDDTNTDHSDTDDDTDSDDD